MGIPEYSIEYCFTYLYNVRRPQPGYKRTQALNMDTSQVQIKIDLGGQEKFFPGSYKKALLVLIGIKLEDIAFEVTGGADAAVISESYESNHDPSNPDIMINFGILLGKHHINVIEAKTGHVLQSQPFTISTDWFDNKLGPPSSFVGVLQGRKIPSPNQLWGTGNTWPTNFFTNEIKSPQKIAVLFFEFIQNGRMPQKDAKGKTVPLPDMFAHWKDQMNNATGESVKSFYKENSYGKVDLTVDVYERVLQFERFEHLFSMINNPTPRWQVSAADVDLVSFLVVNTIHWAFDKKFPWHEYTSFVIAVANRDDGVFITPHAFEHTVTGNTLTVNFHGIFTPWNYEYLSSITKPAPGVDWPGTVLSGVVAHEFGHNNGLLDLYSPKIPALKDREMGRFDLMGDARYDSSFCGVHRMMLGFMPVSWIKLFNFFDGTARDEVVTLTPLGLGNPKLAKDGTARYAIIEIRIALGWSLYVEYRKTFESGIFNDRTVWIDDSVFITDVQYKVSDNRPPIILGAHELGTKDGLGVKSGVLQNVGDDFRALDINTPFRITFVNKIEDNSWHADGKSVQVRIQYGGKQEPDPYIHPKGSGAGLPWQSPDIEIMNAMNADMSQNPPLPHKDGKYRNQPWLGHQNVAVATIYNFGGECSQPVEVGFWDQQVDPITKTWGKKIHRGFEHKPIGANKSEVFWRSFTPDASTTQEYSIFVNITDYWFFGPDGVSIIHETSQDNNRAESRYFNPISASGSPGTRESCQFEVTNELNEEALITFDISQSNPLYRTYLSSRSLRLDPKASHPITIMHEYDPSNLTKAPTLLGSAHVPPLLIPHEGNDRENDEQAKGIIEKFKDLKNEFTITAMATPLNPVGGEEGHVAHPCPVGGIQTSTRQAARTRFENWTVQHGNEVQGRVVIVDGKGVVRSPAEGGRAVLDFSRRESREGGKILESVFRYANIDGEGGFGVNFGSDDGISAIGANTAQARYLGAAAGLADCESEILGIATRR